MTKTQLSITVNMLEATVKKQAARIAALEAENALLKRVEQIFNDSPDLTFECVESMFKDELAKRDLEMQAQGVESLQFPSMLRKMWASWEIRGWINEQASNIRKQAGDL